LPLLPILKQIDSLLYIKYIKLVYQISLLKMIIVYSYY